LLAHARVLMTTQEPGRGRATHVHADYHDPAVVQGAERLTRSGGVPYILRGPAEIGRRFAGLDLVDPGLVQITNWRPDGDPDRLDAYGAIARKP
jgi:S-adenosyl methyltransferase